MIIYKMTEYTTVNITLVFELPKHWQYTQEQFDRHKYDLELKSASSQYRIDSFHLLFETRRLEKYVRSQSPSPNMPRAAMLHKGRKT